MGNRVSWAETPGWKSASEWCIFDPYVPNLVTTLNFAGSPQSAWCRAAAGLIAVLFDASAAPIATNTSPVPDAFVTRRFELLPAAQPAPTLKPVIFPRDNPQAKVEELLYFGEKLWITARARTASPAPSAAKLWVYDFSNDRLNPIKGVLEQYNPTSLWGHGREVWMAVRGGVAAFHSTTFQVEGFDARRGLSAPQVAGIAEAHGRLLVLADSGAVFGLDRTGENFESIGSPAPAANPRAPDQWHQLASSGTSILALGNHTAAGRHALGTQWTSFSDSLATGNTRATPLHLNDANGDGMGGFWIGSDAGLHWVDAGNGTTDNWYWSPGVTIHSGLPATFTPATRPSPASVRAAYDRVLAGIRDRMRDRARLARLRLETQRPYDPVTPSSRLPGAVRAVKCDQQWLWVATTDGSYTAHSRILLFHQPSRKWVGWFAVSLPVTSLCTSDHLVFLGMDANLAPAGNPLLAFEKRAMTGMHSSKWVPDELTDGELGERLAKMPVRERAVLAFFAGDARRVVELLEPNQATASAEEMFLLAFAHDALGLNDQPNLLRHMDQLQQRWPESPFAEAARGFRTSIVATSVGVERLVADANPPQRVAQVSDSAPEPTLSAANANETPTPSPARPAVAAITPPPPAAAPIAPAAVPPRTPDPTPGPEPSAGPKPAPATAKPASQLDAQLLAKVLELHDKDQDGMINKREYREWMGEVRSFDSFDIDEDGKLGPVEIVAFVKQRPKAMLPK